MQARQNLRVAQISALFRVLPLDIARVVFRFVEDDTRADDQALAKLLKHQARIEVSEIFRSVRSIGNTLAQRYSEDLGDFITAMRFSARVHQISDSTLSRSLRWPELSANERARLVGVPGVSHSMGSRFVIASVDHLEPGARLMFDCFARRFIRAHVASCKTPRYFRGVWGRDGGAFRPCLAVPGLPTLHDVELPSLEQLREYVAALDAYLFPDDLEDYDTEDEVSGLFDQ